MVAARSLHYRAPVTAETPAALSTTLLCAPDGSPRGALGVTAVPLPLPLHDERLRWTLLRVTDVPLGDATCALIIPEALAAAAPRRLRTYAAGRLAAAAALAALGDRDIEPSAIGREASGAPRWPVGTVGSIAHTDDLAVAVVADSRDVALLGVDLEMPLGEATALEVHQSIAPECPTESSLVARAPAAMGFPLALTLVFSAKEVLYKALAPRVGQFFGFEAAECVRIDALPGVVTLQLTTDLPGGFVAGDRFAVRVATLPPDGAIIAWLADDRPSSSVRHPGH
jgi:enterobactin synthetase component D